MTRLGVGLVIAGLVALAGWLTYERFHLIAEGRRAQVIADQTGADRQREADTKVLTQESRRHAKELEDLVALYGPSAGELHIVRYVVPPRPLPPPAVPPSGSPPAGVVSCDGRMHPDLDRAYELLEWAGDTLAAACRELNNVTHQ